MMSEDPQVPKSPEPADESAPEMETSQPPEMRSEAGPAAAGEAQAGSDSVNRVERPGAEETGSESGFLQRLTGSLRRLTGSLFSRTDTIGGETGEDYSNRLTGQLRAENAPLEENQSLEGSVPVEQDLAGQRLTGQLRADTASLEEEQRFEPGDRDSIGQRITGQLRADASPLEDKTGESQGLPSSADEGSERRLTGSLRRGTGPLVEPEELPSEPEETARRLTGDLREDIASVQDQASEEAAPAETQDINRLTGTLRGDTTPLQEESSAEDDLIRAAGAWAHPDDIQEDFFERRMGIEPASEPEEVEPAGFVTESTPEDIEPPASQTDDFGRSMLLEDMQPTPPEESTPQGELDDDFLAGRLSGEPFHQPGSQSVEPEEPFEVLRNQQDWDAPAVPPAQNEPADSTGRDWMAEIRQEAQTEEPSSSMPAPESGMEAQPEEQFPERPASRSSNPLRIITGILRGERRRQEDEEQMPDDLVTGRLERSMRQTAGRLTAEQGEQRTGEEKESTTGRLFRRLTGSLRRTTGPLRRTTGQLPGGDQGPAEESQESPEVSMLSRREEQEEAAPPSMEAEVPFSVIPAEPAVEPRFFEAQESEQDWQAEIRHETQAEEPAPVASLPAQIMEDQTEEQTAEKPAPRSSNLLHIITGIFRGERRKKKTEEQMPDDLVTGRLERSMRQTAGKLTAEQVEQIESPEEAPGETGVARTTGRLFRRLTGSLRRVTGALRGQTDRLPGGTGDLVEEPFPTEEVSDSLVEERLAGPAEPEENLAEIWSEEPPPIVIEPSQVEPLEPITFEPMPFEPEPPGPIVFDLPLEEEGEVPQFPEQFGVEETGESTGDWMSQIRQEAAEEETTAPPEMQAPGAEPPPSEQPEREPRGPLSFITGILRSPEERQKRSAGEELPDEMLTDRLGRSLGEVSEAATAPKEEEVFPGLPTSDQPIETPPLFPEEELTFEEGTPYGGAFPEEPGAETIQPGLSPEDETLLWGEEPGTGTPFGGPTLTPKDIWGETPAPPAEEVSSRAPGMTDDQYASLFLTGQELPPAPEAEQEQLLHEALERSKEKEEEEVSFEDLRAIALEDYQEAPTEPEPAHPRVQIVSGEEQAEEEDFYFEPSLEPAAAPFSLREWITERTPIEKILMVEATVVFAVLLVAIPFFIYMMNRPPVYKVGYLIPRPLPANMPYPTGIVLPGGWSFPLQKSTFVEGQWKPVTSEWLEGTELRRVVALPWNPQTEAVIRTFAPGDKILLEMSNSDTLDYTITKVERVAASDATILSDRRPSLVVILYRENAAERWVVFCKP